MTAAADLPRRAYSPAEVAAQLSVPYETVLGLIHDGRLSALKIGRYYRIPIAALDTLLSEED